MEITITVVLFNVENDDDIDTKDITYVSEEEMKKSGWFVKLNYN